MATAILLDRTKTYKARKIEGDRLHMTGSGNDPEWKRAVELTDFIYPWENKKSSSMSFRALHSKYWVYCLFMVKDNDIQVFVKNNDKLEVVKSERAEIFFRSDEKLSPYYCLELDPVGRIFDYQAEFHRKFNTDWVWPTGKLIVKTNRTKDGYTVELAVHKQSLLDLRLLDKQKIQAAIFRAECHDEYGVEENMKWISWIKPKSEEPDFHIPSSFGILELEE